MDPLTAMGLQVGLGALSSWMGGSASKYNAKAQAYAQQAQALANANAETRQLTKQLQLQGQQNELVAEANLQSLINTHLASSLLGVKMAEQKRAAANALKVNRRNSALQLGAVTTNAAAAGTIGASVNAVASDIERKASEGVVAVHDQLDAERYNHSVEVANLYRSYELGVARLDTTMPEAVQTPILGPINVGGGGFGSHLLGSALNVGMGYLNSQIQLGLGPSPAANTGNSVKLYGLMRGG